MGRRARGQLASSMRDVQSQAGCVQVRLLGPLEVAVDGRPVAIARSAPRAVLASLALRAGRQVSAETLIDEVYDDALPANPRNALQIQLSVLRRELDEAGVPDVVVTEGSGYRLAVAADDVDVHRFRRLIDEVADGLDDGPPPAELLDATVEALALWRGEPLADLGERQFAAAAADRLALARLDAIEMKAELLLSLGRHREAAVELGSLVDAHPLRERASELLMVAYYRSGRQADALRTYDNVRAVLADELGVDPGPALRRTHAAVLAHDPSLDLTAPAASPGTAGKPMTPEAASPVPAPVGRLIGREHELGALQELAAASRLLTLTGPGGVGKTRLAIELVRGVPGDAWYVDLGSITREEDVAAAVAQALGLPVLPGRDPLAGAAATRPAGTLLLDTCEHVVEAAAHAAVRVLELCPSLRVVATSRRPLLVRGETAWPTPPLSLPGQAPDGLLPESDAMRFFVARAAAARPGFTLDGENVADVAAICTALDGLPLALELAAARVEVLPLPILRERLADPFHLLTGGARDAAARHQSLGATVEWSLGLLNAEESQLLARLSVIPGSFSLDLVLEMGDDQPDPVATMSSLVHHSLVSADGTERFRVLDTLREYTRRDAGADATAAHSRLLRWAAGLAGSTNIALHGSGQLEAMDRLRTEAPNIRAALDWSLGGADPRTGVGLASRMAWFWYLAGAHADAYRWLSAALLAPEADPADRVGVLVGAGIHAMALGRLFESNDLLTEAVGSARAVGNRTLESFATANLGSAQWAIGDLDRAAATLETVTDLDAAPDEPLRWVRAYATALRARVAIDAGDDESAFHHLERARRDAVELADDHLIAVTGRFRARVVLDADPRAALELATDALARNERLGFCEGTALSLQVAGKAWRRLGEPNRGASMIRRSLALAAAADHVIGMCHAFEELGAIHADLGEHASGRSLIAVATIAREALDLPRTPTERRLVADLETGSPDPGHRASAGFSAGAARARLRAAATAASSTRVTTVVTASDRDSGRTAAGKR